MRRPAMHRQGRAAGDVTHLRIFANTEFFVARIERWIGEHCKFPGTTIIPLRTRSDFERPHVRRYVHAGYIESERGDTGVLISSLRRAEIPVPWLRFGALKWVLSPAAAVVDRIYRICGDRQK